MTSLHRCVGVMMLLLAAASPSQADLEAGVDAVARRDFAAALNEFMPLAERGDVAAQVNLGNLYMKGLGVRQNYGEALRWYRNAAEQNERMAQSKLGILYYYGLGVPQDYAEAGSWFLKAAEQGESGAQAILGSLYALGEGMPRDFARAYYWYSLAADQGNEDASMGRASLVDEMTPGEMDEALRLLSEARRRVDKSEEMELDRVADPDNQPKPAKHTTSAKKIETAATSKKKGKSDQTERKQTAKPLGDQKKQARKH